MAKKEGRFIITYKEGGSEAYRIIVDRETGVNYLFYRLASSGGLTPLLDSNGKPIITMIYDEK